jgi:hypothetical protein
MNQNVSQAIEDEDEGLHIVDEDIDYDAIYGGEDIKADLSMSSDLKKSYSSIFKDIAKQGIKETLIGAGGAYGDLAELIGGKSKQSQREKEKIESAFQAEKKMKEPGYKPSMEDIEALSSDEDIGGMISPPSSEDLRSLNNFVGGPEEAETTAGKYAARSGKLYGSGLAFGQVNPLPAIVGGVLGQATEEVGGGPLAQAASEIIGLLATPSSTTKKLITSGKEAIKNKISDLRKLGYAEEDITLAINSAYKDSRTAQIASKGAKTEEAFENFAKNSDKIVDDILSSGIPGIEKGTKNVHQMASDVYGSVAREGANFTINNSRPFLDASKKVVDQLQNTLGKNPEAQSFIKRISEAAMEATQYPTAEKMMNFYKELNSMGHWMGRSHRDKLISQLKEGIKDTFRSEGKNGRDLASKFEEANLGIQKAYKAEDLHDLIQRVSTQDGIDYKRFRKLFDKEDNINLFKEVLGPEQAKNMRLISNVGAEVKDFDKSWKAAKAFGVGSAADFARGAAASYYIYQGDWEGLAKVAATKLGTTAIKKIAEKSLTDPKFQNLIIKGLHAVKVESPKLMKSADAAMKKYLEEEGIDLDEI